ncbi:hypothetical protein EYZ11_004821 [Aspergillus tanneri]|uniref:F-box domain-containing protein n=1 Tax=Aspergillus tanneri TaxID=1220188 RepID=A0A4S3JJH5_9EURO|nr:uncharacterized protein ATNIH1004_007949 [Aspergillus tanneri]KAA8646516.1 hypothetical protein ATNIH1004_007949 [Aspergillus tanneri]THC95699.1 hypothetical protein EYZ11_004821 [Aspergillus tanneri]
MTVVTKNLDSIPYDVFYQVASTLDCHDFVHLSRVNRALNSMMRSESIARKTVENNLLQTKEGQKANRTKEYRRAVGRLFDIKEAFATAQPYSASVLGYGSAFLYSGGSLCYIYNDEIRALDVHGAGQMEQVLNLYSVLSRAIPGCNPAEDTTQISLMEYGYGVLAFLVEIVERREAWLLAVDMRRKKHCAKNGRLRLRTQLQSTRRLFVRHNESYLYYGTHSALGYHGYPQWAVSCVNLTTGQHITDKPVELENFAGFEIGQTVCFGIHDNHFYAVSTQVDFEEEEVDWTSFYVWVCLAPSRNPGSVTLNQTWRRQHREGPINDTWSDLSLRQDESTRKLMILECRREWLDGGSENCRTYYVQPLPSPAEIRESKRQGGNAGRLSAPAPLPDEPLTKTLDSSNKPKYERPRKRLRRHFHPEYQLGCDGDMAQRQDFILAKTKYRTYNLSASTFVDLVNDPGPIPGGSFVPHDRMRLRMVSRKRKCPIDEDGDEGPKGFLYKPELATPDGTPIEYSEERFTSRGIRLWPPDNAPQEIHHLLCPSKRAGKVHAVADERSIVYSVDQDGLTPGNQAIILINFDPSLRLTGLQHLPMPEQLKAQTTEAGVSIEQPRAGNIGREHPVAHTATVSWNRANQAMPSVREEPAMYLSIRRGYWLR